MSGYKKYPDTDYSGSLGTDYVPYPSTDYTAYPGADYTQHPNALWSPLVATPSVWLDSDAASFTLNATQVSAWADKSGNGRHFTQATPAAQPTYVSSSTIFNSRPTVKFDVLDSSLSSGAGLTIKDLFIVASSPLTSFATNTGLFRVVASSQVYRGEVGTVNWRTVDALAGTRYRNNVTTDSALSTANAKQLYRLTATAAPTGSFSLGRDLDASGRQWQGEVAEMIGLTSTADAALLANLTAYFNAKYGAWL